MPGSMYSLKIASGVSCATSSISMPPGCEAMKTTLPDGAVEDEAEVELAVDGGALLR